MFPNTHTLLTSSRPIWLVLEPDNETSYVAEAWQTWSSLCAHCLGMERLLEIMGGWAASWFYSQGKDEIFNKLFFFSFPRSLCRFPSLTRPQSPASSSSHGSRTRKWSGPSSPARPTSTSAAPSATPSASSASALQLHHVHHQLLHVRWRLPEPAVDDEDRRSLLRPHATQLRTPDTAVSRVSSACSTASRPSTSSLQLSATQLAANISTTRLQQLPSAAATHAAGPRAPSRFRPPTCWVPSSTPCAPRTVTGAPAPSAWHAHEPWRVDEMKAWRRSINWVSAESHIWGNQEAGIVVQTENRGRACSPQVQLFVDEVNEQQIDLKGKVRCGQRCYGNLN